MFVDPDVGCVLFFFSRPNEVVPAECAVKIFKTSLNKFHNRCQYVRGDVRFFKDEFKKYNPRKIMAIWAEKEVVNLKRFVSFKLLIIFTCLDITTKKDATVQLESCYQTDISTQCHITLLDYYQWFDVARYMLVHAQK